jgi:hypothetical protein
MGMIKEGEIYYQVIGGDNTSAAQGKTDEQ